LGIADFAMNIAVAMLLGIAIGLERQYRQHPAGLRTNTLVCVGAALFVSLSRLMENDGSPTRIAGQVASGIGFLGGGVILREGLNVRGMNTAATLWCSAAIGTLAGAGFLLQGLVGTAAILVIHLGLRPIVIRMEAFTKESCLVESLYRIRAVCDNQHAPVIRAIFMRHINSQPHMTVQGIASQETDDPLRRTVSAEVFSHERNDKFMNELVSRIAIEPSVSEVRWEKVA
jgi:putative Mg2+ transporter-C (MgtC) family protein